MIFIQSSFTCRRCCNQVALSVYVYLFGNIQKIPKIWRKATVIALRSLPSQRRTRATGSSHCCAFMLLERMIHGRINPIIDPWSFVDEDCFEAKEIAGAILVDLTAAYDTLWHRGLTLKLPGCCQIDIWCTSLWNWFQTAALCSRQAMDGKTDSRMVSPRDLSWLHCCLISTYMTSPIPSPESTALPMT